MTTTIQPELDFADASAHEQSEVAAMAYPASASKVANRAAVVNAVTLCASEHHGRVHISWMRAHLPEWIDPHMVGSVTSALDKSGFLETVRDDRGEPVYLPNGGFSSKNGSKPAALRRLVAAIPSTWPAEGR